MRFVKQTAWTLALCVIGSTFASLAQAPSREAGRYRRTHRRWSQAGIVFGTSTVLAWQVFGHPERLDPFWVGAPMTAAIDTAGWVINTSSISRG